MIDDRYEERDFFVVYFSSVFEKLKKKDIHFQTNFFLVTMVIFIGKWKTYELNGKNINTPSLNTLRYAP